MICFDKEGSLDPPFYGGFGDARYQIYAYVRSPIEQAIYDWCRVVIRIHLAESCDAWKNL